MPTSVRGADVVVVGGGLVGSSLAYELVTGGAEVVLIDRHDPGRATDAGAGILSPETYQDPDPLLFAFGMAAAHHYQGLHRRLLDDGVADTGFAVTGSLLIADRPEDEPFLAMAEALVEARSPGLIHPIGAAEARRHVPVLGPVQRALHSPAARRVDGRVLNDALRQAAVGRGLRVVTSDATGVELDQGRGTVSGVVTAEGTVPAGAVVVAGGAWSRQLGSVFGVDIPVRPLKGQIVHLTLPGTDIDTGSWPIVQPVLGFYLVPWPGGRVACGGTMEAQAGFDHRPTAGGLHQLLRECLRTAPGLAEATVTEVRVGSRPATPDGRPVLGALPGWGNAYVATGHGAEGLLLGPYSALLVARAVLGVEATGPPGAESAGAEAAAQVFAMCEPGRFAGSS
jgi:D-amino-acid dehydrogenase